MDYKPLLKNATDYLSEKYHSLAENVNSLLSLNSGLENRLVPVNVPISFLNQPQYETSDKMRNYYLAGSVVTDYTWTHGGKIRVTISGGEIDGKKNTTKNITIPSVSVRYLTDMYLRQELEVRGVNIGTKKAKKMVQVLKGKQNRRHHF
ncbi:MAG: hypothetical protein IH934_06590 [Nanoarchaeota archaeon]|nr:hypothetical protein [Nanoarchaeota archaeon]